MRLWSIHPKYLDSKGIVALWREGLLAQKVLKGHTKGYKNHPQLIRFKEHAVPVSAISTYLSHVEKDAQKRGFEFDKTKIKHKNTEEKIKVSKEQLKYEFEHLKKKLENRDKKKLKEINNTLNPEPHPFVQVIKGPVERWEKA